MQALLREINLKLGCCFDFKLSEDINNPDKLKFMKCHITECLQNCIVLNIALYLILCFNLIIFMALKKFCDKFYIPFIFYSLTFIVTIIINYNNFKYIHHIIHNRKITIKINMYKFRNSYEPQYDYTISLTENVNTEIIALDEDEECKI